MPLSVVYGCVFSEWQVDVLQVVEERYLDTITVCLDHKSSVRWNVWRAEEKILHMYAAYIKKIIIVNY